MDGLIVKHNSVLQPLTMFNLEERRLFSFCLQYYDSREGAENPTTLVVPLEKIRKAFPDYAGYKPNILFKKLEAAANGIQSKGYRPNPDEHYVIWWFSSLDMRDKENIKFSLTTESMPFFLNISKNYISYHLSDVKLMGKPTSWNLYEYLKENFRNGQQGRWVIEVLELKERLGVLYKYKRFADFDLYCLKNPKKDINVQTDITFSYTKIKKGKAVSAIVFEVTKRYPQAPDAIEGETSADRIKNGLLSAGLRLSEIENWITQGRQNDTLSHLDKDLSKILKSSKEKGVRNRQGYVSQSVKNIIDGVRQQTFEDVLIDKDKVLEEYRGYATSSLKSLAQNANIYAQQVLAERDKT